MDQHKESHNSIVREYRGRIASFEEVLRRSGFTDYKTVRWDRGVSEKDAALFDFTGIP